MKKHSPKFLKLVNEAKANIQQTNPRSVHDRQSAGESLHLLDVRELNEWQNGHLPGAVYLGKGVLERDIEKLFPELAKDMVVSNFVRHFDPKVLLFCCPFRISFKFCCLVA